MQFHSHSLHDTHIIASKIQKTLYPFSNILLFGEMGAGKTHFIQSLGKSLGITERMKSPTFAYQNSYERKSYTLHHFDLYRLESSQQLEQLDELFHSQCDLVITEWSEKITPLPQNYIQIQIKKTGENSRIFDIQFKNTGLSNEKILSVQDNYRMPLSIRKHTEKVAHIANNIANIHIKNGNILDTSAINTSAHLHDLVKYIDYVDQYDEIQEKDFHFWKKIQKKFHPHQHEYAAAKILENMGHKEVSKIISAHQPHQIFNGFHTTEEAIVFYADKRVLHDQIVSIEQRISDGKKRYGKPGEEEHWKNFLEKVQILEKSLLFGNSPENIV